MYVCMYVCIITDYQLLLILFETFRRMNYEDAIAWLKTDGYKKEDGTFYEFGEVRQCFIVILL